MAIQIPNPGTGNGASGDNEFVLWSKVKDNFTDQTNAAGRLVGITTGRIPLVEDIQAIAFGNGLSKSLTTLPSVVNLSDAPVGFHYTGGGVARFPDTPYDSNLSSLLTIKSLGSTFQILTGYQTYSSNILYMRSGTQAGAWLKIYHDKNTTKDSNGMLKASSPVLRVFSAHIEGNEDGEKMGATFIKNSVGNYLLKGTTGLADEGWYVTVPQDANGNNLVAVEYESLENGDVVLRTYKRKFDFETVSIVADHDNPLDIPDTRWVDLRFNEIPFEMPDDTQTEV